MDNINDIIASIIAIQNYSKDIHYNCIGKEGYSWHILADRVQDNLSDYIDRLKEYMLGCDINPLTSKEYLSRAIEIIPDIERNTILSFTKLQNLIVGTLNLIEETKLNKAGDNLISEIADNLTNSNGIINLVIS